MSVEPDSLEPGSLKPGSAEPTSEEQHGETDGKIELSEVHDDEAMQSEEASDVPAASEPSEVHDEQASCEVSGDDEAAEVSASQEEPEGAVAAADDVDGDAEDEILEATGEASEETEESEEDEEILVDLTRSIESLIFASNKPLSLSEMQTILGADVDALAIKRTVEQLIEAYQDRGVVLQKVAGGYQFRTHEASGNFVQKLVAGKPVRLSRAQTETLAIVAYRQPVTRPEIDEIRGVDSGGTLRVLIDRSLIRILGKKEEAGRPLLYGTSKQFLEFFNLSELRELPTLREFHELSEESLDEAERRGVDLRDLSIPDGFDESASEDAASAAAEEGEPGQPMDDESASVEVQGVIDPGDSPEPPAEPMLN